MLNCLLTSIVIGGTMLLSTPLAAEEFTGETLVIETFGQAVGAAPSGNVIVEIISQKRDVPLSVCMEEIKKINSDLSTSFIAFCQPMLASSDVESNTSI